VFTNWNTENDDIFRCEVRSTEDIGLFLLPIVFLFFFSREQISEMLCELYSPSVSMPEAPKQNFFAKLFASNSMIDSDQLCKLFFI